MRAKPRRERRDEDPFPQEPAQALDDDLQHDIDASVNAASCLDLGLTDAAARDCLLNINR
jgi:hypothetical protein